MGEPESPTLERCGCGEEVLMVTYRGDRVAVEPHEHDPTYDGRFPEYGLRVDDEGRAREYKASQGRREGEAVHRLHECEVVGTLAGVPDRGAPRVRSHAA